ncbi:MAG: phosphoenolpyruvate carboxykinase [Fusobacteriaceae bacterium]
MKNEIAISRNSIIMNFTMRYCSTSEELLESSGFAKILTLYIERLSKKDTPVYRFISETFKEEKNELVEPLKKLLKLITVLDLDEIKGLDKKYANLFEHKEIMFEFIEGLYNFWRKFERYAVVRNRTNNAHGIQNASFVDSMNSFTNLVLKTYRKTEETVMGYNHRVYRQSIAGANAGIVLNEEKWNCPVEYSFLEKIPFIKSIILQPPFIVYPKKNTRKGTFEERLENPIENLDVELSNWMCFPAKVGELLAFVYFDTHFMAQGVTLCNLFELAKKEEYTNKKPDMIYMYGVKDFEQEMKTVFHNDKKNKIMVGYANYNEDIDYFGYMKKMILTLHNLKMIEQGHLPIHGAMVNITMKNGKTSNVCIMGDSGAGKSESLEAFRILSEEYVKDMKIIFDDMGTFKLSDGAPKAYGTEVGAFIRLDDLDSGYAYNQIDRSIFMNPDKINSRVVIPVATHDEITRGYPIDMFLYANNYEEGDSLEFFDDEKKAIKVFKAGARFAKGTTSEVGLVESYFANPFGPFQKQKETDKLIQIFFDDMFKKGVKVGQIRTQLGIKGQEHEGPKRAAKNLFDLIMKS